MPQLGHQTTKPAGRFKSIQNSGDTKHVKLVWMWAGRYAMMGAFLLALHPTVDPTERINLPEDH